MEKRYTPADNKVILRQIIISSKGKSKINFSTVLGLGIAYGYTRLQTSHFGVFVEFDLSQIYMPALYFHTQGNPHFFVWHPDNHPNVNILEARHQIEGTSFIPGLFYVHPKDLLTHGMKVMR